MKRKLSGWPLIIGVILAGLLVMSVILVSRFKAGKLTLFGLNASVASISDLPPSGISLDDLRSRLGLAVRHQFTVKKPDGTYVMASCFFHGADQEMWFILRDNRLIKIVVPFALAKFGDAWNIDDPVIVTSINDIIDAPAATHKEVAEDLKPEPVYTSDNELPFFITIPLAAVGAVHLAPSILSTRRLLGRYSGFKLNLGMNATDVRRLYGKPTGTSCLREGETVYIYQSNNKNHSQLTFNGMAVVMDRGGIVTECLSDGFFNPNWQGGSE